MQEAEIGRMKLARIAESISWTFTSGAKRYGSSLTGPSRTVALFRPA